MAFDALVLLGCRVEPTALSGAAERRAERAARAFHEGLAPRVVVSGGGRWAEALEAEVLGRALELKGVPKSALLLEGDSRNTLENARYTARLLLPLGLVHVGLVSCDWHLPRALWAFRRAGLDPEAVPAASPPLSAGQRSLRTVREQATWLLGRVAALGW